MKELMPEKKEFNIRVEKNPENTITQSEEKNQENVSAAGEIRHKLFKKFMEGHIRTPTALVGAVAVAAASAAGEYLGIPSWVLQVLGHLI